MDKIVLKDFEVTACHGVNPSEKVTPQRFLISVTVYADICAAADFDDLDLTVSYSAVKKEVKNFAENNCFDLIETLAVRLARLLLRKFDLAQGVKVTVKKPDAPMSGKFEYAAVETELKWHRIYLSLGSNLGDANGYLDFAVKSLQDHPAFKNVRESSRIESAPYGGVADRIFSNSVVEADSYLSPEELLRAVNAIESKAGRVRDIRWGNRTLDIDILLYDDIVYDRNGLSIPHYDMLNREFVLKPLAELAPYKIHPLSGKRAAELLDELERKFNA